MQRVGSILSLFAAEEIPAAMITFVSLLIFLQTGVSPAWSVCYSSLLFLPWVLKSFLREKIRRMARFRRALQWSELLLVLCLLLMGLSLDPSNRLFVLTGLSSGRGIGIFLFLFAISLLTAWHELAARMYYERMLRPQLQRLYNGPKIVISQMMVVFTYGLLIIFVGTLQVLCRSIFMAWSLGMFLTGVVLSFFFVYHLFTLKACPVGDNAKAGTMLHAAKTELHIIERVRKRRHWYMPVMMLFVLLLPQSLMFYSRVLFFLASESEGGLGRSIQDVGFAQGVMGVIFFCLGISLGRRYLCHAKTLCIILTLSPWVYLVLTHIPSVSLIGLSVATSIAQFYFGFGLNACHPFVHEISGARYRNTINYLYVPLVATVMLPAMLVSGFMVDQLGFSAFFLVDSLCAPLAWVALLVFVRLASPTFYRSSV